MPTIRPRGVDLFSNGQLRVGIQARSAALRDAVDDLPIQSLSDPASVDALVARFRIRVPELHRGDITVTEPVEVKIDGRPFVHRRSVRESANPRMVDGIRITFTVPFEGEAGLFQIASSLVPSNPPVSTVEQGVLILVYELIEAQQDELRVSFERELDLVDMFLEDLRRDAAPYNRNLPQTALQLVERRRKRRSEAAEFVESLGFPLTRRTDPPKTFEVPISRRPLAAKDKGTRRTPDWHLSDEDYQLVVRDLQRIAQVIEYSPSAFAQMSEEDIRWIFLIPLNLIYEGEAVGEAFNYGGKTDILLRKDGRSVFVAECLIWDGPAYLNDKIDQLLGYLAWRDTKAALLVFSRRKRFSDILSKTQDSLASHELHTRSLGRLDATAFRFELKRRDDPARKVELTVLCFDVRERGTDQVTSQ